MLKLLKLTIPDHRQLEMLLVMITGGHLVHQEILNLETGI